MNRDANPFFGTNQPSQVSGPDELLADLRALIDDEPGRSTVEEWIVDAKTAMDAAVARISANATLAARCGELQADLATFANLARRMMDMHPGCATCMERGTTVAPGKFCPDCGWHQRVTTAFDGDRLASQAEGER